MINLGVVKPLLFEQNLIIVLSINWVDKLANTPKFSVEINKPSLLSLTSVSPIKREREFAK